ncbi:hypothetical protein LIER_38500 [Lithospermum erythrorhizon]|uniref:Uncharacterized protein n=1 Tax=Lithospermum erythrorhizon TaxID=34254 RepID=A0AAV3Q0V2_LITER
MPKVASRLQSLMTRSPTMPSDKSNTSSTNSPSTEVVVTDKVISNPTPELNAARGLAPIKACTDPNHTETSQAGRMSIQPFDVTTLGESSQLVVPATHATGNPTDLTAAARADAAYQGISFT